MITSRFFLLYYYLYNKQDFSKNKPKNVFMKYVYVETIIKSEHKSHLTPIIDFSDWLLFGLDVSSPNVGGLDP